MALLTSSIYKRMERAATHLFSKNRAFFSKLSNFYFDLRLPGQTPGQDREVKTRPHGKIECAIPRGWPGGGSGLELTDALLPLDGYERGREWQ